MREEKQLLSNPDIVPDSMVLTEALGAANGAYITFTEGLKNHDIDLEYRYYTDSKAWLCKGTYTQIGSRGGKKQVTAFWLSIWDSYFKVAIYMPEKSRFDLLKLPFTDEIRMQIEKSSQLGKMKIFPLVFDLSSEELIDEIYKLIDFRKMLK